jgi:nucleotide-binding universal stress UspA family protein
MSAARDSTPTESGPASGPRFLDEISAEHGRFARRFAELMSDPTFDTVLCGVDGTREGLEAARQAALLAGPSATFELIAVTPAAGHPMFPPLPDAGRRALADARHAVRALGRDAATSSRPAATPVEGLLGAAAGHELLAVGCHEFTEPLGVSTGPVTGAAVELAGSSVLVARRMPDASVVDSVLVAVDGSPAAHRATAYAAEIASRHGSTIALVAAPARDEAHRRALAEDAAAIAAATGAEPVILDEYGSAAPAIVAASATIGATLIVLGSRAPRRPRLRPSVSQQVARTAACSVLIVRAPAARE